MKCRLFLSLFIVLFGQTFPPKKFTYDREDKGSAHGHSLLSQIGHYGLLGFCFFRRVDFVWLLMSNSELLRIKNGQKTPYKKQKTASSHKKIK